MGYDSVDTRIFEKFEPVQLLDSIKFLMCEKMVESLIWHDKWLFILKSFTL